MFIHLAKDERWYKCFGDLPRVPGLQEVAQQSANKGAHDCPSCTLVQVPLLGAMVPGVSPCAIPKVGQKFRQMSTLLHTAQGKQASILALVIMMQHYKNIIVINKCIIIHLCLHY